MLIFSRIIGAAWFVFIVYWGVSALGAKRSVGSRFAQPFFWISRAIFAAVILALLFSGRFSGFTRYLGGATPQSPVLGALGAALAVLGVALAVWARAALGSNWGMPMTRKETPELVTKGPYRYVRHPIYTGLVLSLLGSGLAGSAFWLLALPFTVAYFLYSAAIEEKIMSERFPREYGAYRARTKRFVPFVW